MFKVWMRFSVVVLLCLGGYAQAVEQRDGFEMEMREGRLESGDSTARDGSFFDTHSFDVQRDEEIIIDLVSDDFDAFLRVETPGGEKLSDDDGGDGSNSQVTFTAERDGSCVITVYAFAADETGDYELYMQHPVRDSRRHTASRGPVVVNGLLSNTDLMQNGKYYDLYVFEADRGDSIEIDMTASFDTYLIVRRPTGSELTDDDSGEGVNAQLQFTANSSGTYEILATTYSRGTTGSYVLTVLGVSEVTSSHEEDTNTSPSNRGGLYTQQGTLSSGDLLRNDKYYDCYSFYADRDEQIVIDMTSSYDNYLIVHTPSGSELADDDGGDSLNARLDFVADEAGTYEVWASSYGRRQTGAYTLERTGGSDWGSCSDSHITDSRQRQLREENTESMRGRLQSGDERSRRNSYCDVYTFWAQAGDRVQVDMTSDDFDTYLYVTDPAGNESTNDDGGDGRNSRLSFTADQTGRYEIKAAGFSSSSTGSYELQITGGEQLQRSSSVQTNNDRNDRENHTETARGRLESGDSRSSRDSYCDIYTFRAQAGDTVQVDLTSDDYDTYLFVTDPDGYERSNDDGGDSLNSRLSFTANSTGTYEVQASAFSSSATGYYELIVTGGEDLRQSSNGGSGYRQQRPETARGRLGSGDRMSPRDSYCDVYTFRAQSGDRVQVDLTSDDFDTYLYVRAPSGYERTNDDGGDGLNSSLSFTANETGTYEILASGYGSSSTGSYELSVTGGEELRESGGGSRRDRGHGSRRGNNETLRGRLSRGDRTLDDGSYYDVHTFYVRRGDRVEIAMESDDFDTYLHVEVPGGNVLTNDDGGSGTNSVVNFVAERDGQCEIKANSYSSGETGDYIIYITVE
ncbi:MAG: PPC domain-containing protein [Sedimentisphaerales bacterium]|nr:PPC domain-containing protein [Sedimentisphaerales bacterium]